MISNQGDDPTSSTGDLGGGGGGGGGAEAVSSAAVAAARAPSTTSSRTTKAKPPKKRSRTDDAAGGTTGSGTTGGAGRGGVKKRKPRRAGSGGSNEHSSANTPAGTTASFSPAAAVKDQLRRVLEEDQYSANGSIVETDSDSDDGGGGTVEYRGSVLRLDRPSLMQYAKEYMNLLTGTSGSGTVADSSCSTPSAAGPSGTTGGHQSPTAALGKKGKEKGGRSAGSAPSVAPVSASTAATLAVATTTTDAVNKELEEELDLDGGSIFGQTTGSSNFTWVCCDRCKKWRRLRGVVDEKKLPSRWYCSMNKNDPERNRCSAPEEEYDTNHTTPESAADARCRKHLRVWVRRLQCNETYEARQPTLTRGKKKAQSSSKEPYEWIRCCNPSCGKWRSLLRIMESKSVIEKTQDGEWYCVMNTWDEKVASCAAPQENLPAVGCPPWVLQDDS